MGAVIIGPFALPADRAAALLGIVVFLVAAGFLAHRIDRRFDTWASLVVAAGLISARIGHVVAYWPAFAPDPWRALAVWQGGFSALWALPAAAAVTLWRLRDLRSRLWSALPLGAGLIAWAAALHALAMAAAAIPAPPLLLARLNGPPLDFAVPVGKPRIVNLWATWCPPCRREMPRLVKAAAAHPGIDFLFADQGEAKQAVAAYADRFHMPRGHVLLDPVGALGQAYKSSGLPTTLFIGADGRLRAMRVGELSPEALAAEIDRLGSGNR
jgi:thiol-disulfide isomerase/thioredoxin